MMQCQHANSNSVVWLPRWAWGADPDLPRLGTEVPLIKRRHLIVHHTVVVDDDATGNVWESMGEITANMRRLQTIRPDLGRDVPYNLVVYLMPEGIVVCEGRGWDRSGAHTAGRPTPDSDKYNESGIGMAFAGDFEAEAPEGLQARLIKLYLWLRSYRKESPMPPLEVLGHRDTKATLCPGQNLYQNLHLWGDRC